MIGSLRGTLLGRSSATELLLEVGGVGYRVQVTGAAVPQLGAVGSEVFVYTHHLVREDREVLYGFSSVAERATFEALIEAHRVGPALALAILEVHSPAALRTVVADNDTDALCEVPGIGRKTAVRLLVELKSKLDLPEAETPPDGDQPDEGARAADAARADVRHALASLGYSAEEVRLAMAELPDDAAPEDLVRKALESLAAGVGSPQRRA